MLETKPKEPKQKDKQAEWKRKKEEREVVQTGIENQNDSNTSITSIHTLLSKDSSLTIFQSFKFHFIDSFLLQILLSYVSIHII